MQASFASKTTWDALGVESGEETEDEQIEEPVTEPARYVALGYIDTSMFLFC
jgi:hypothetical protein